MPAPSSTVAPFVARSAGVHRARTSTSGSLAASSTHTQATASSAVAADAASTGTPVTPTWGTRLMASSSAVSQPESSPAAVQPTGREPPGGGVTGSHRRVAAADARVRPAGSQKSQWWSSTCSTTPASTVPSAPDTVSAAETIATVPAQRGAGTTSRTRAKASGNTAPPAPWTTRPASITGSEAADALTTQPAARTTSDQVRALARPKRSPSRPITGVSTDATSR